jgi:large subunit ribosomal protein L10
MVRSTGQANLLLGGHNLALSFEAKKAVVAEVSEIASNAFSLVGAEYRGLTVAELSELRNKARESGVYVRVVPNNLARRSVQGTEFECVSDSLVGPMILGFSQEDLGSAARVMGDFAKGNAKLVIKMVALGGELLPPSQLAAVAALPTRDEALAQLMAVMKAPVEKLVRTLNEPHAKLVRTFAALKDQKEAA